MLRKKQKGQSLLEYVFILTVILAVFTAMGQYVKRGLQGRWKAVVDDMGDQYDPRLASGLINHTFEQDVDTRIFAFCSTEGLWTERIDTTTTVERRFGQINTGPY